MIVDEVSIILKSGRGGCGFTSFSKFSSRRIVGSGGDGGKGGNVIIKVSSHPYDLNKFRSAKRFCAEDGQPGENNNKKGRDGKDNVILVPKGTVVRDNQGEIFVDLNDDDMQWLACRGGMEGKGNNRKLYTLEPQPGEEKEFILDYRIPNDVIIIGFPNSGKTSLFNKLTGKDHKVAEYPFTTNAVSWAKAEITGLGFTVLDTPPLKKLESSYLESYFLKHIYRSKIVLFLMDNALEFKNDCQLLKKIVTDFDKYILKGKKIFYLLTKVDTIENNNIVDSKSIINISLEKNIGIDKLKAKILSILKNKL